jgi:hypothetical protein
VSARRLLGFVCIVSFWGTGHLIGEFYPFSPLAMFNSASTMSSRLFVRDVAGNANEIARYDAWRCDGPLDFTPTGAPSCTEIEYTAYDEIVRDYIQSHPAAEQDAVGREVVEISRRVFRIPHLLGPVEITDCALVRCTAHRRPPWSWTPRL